MIGPNSDKNDPFEEFEFKPINEGLGFHIKNKATATTSTPSPSLFQTSLSIPSEVSRSPFITSLPRTDETSTKRPSFKIPSIEDDSIAKAQTAVNDILKNLNQKRQLDFAQDAEKEKLSLKKSRPQLFASVLDGMLVVAAFLMTLIVMLSITKVDMIVNLTHPETSGWVYLATFGLLAGVIFIYMVVNRAFLGFTAGEWAFDQQCGDTKTQSNFSYIPKVALRTLMVMASGFVVIPFLSYLFNKDIAGQLSGVSLYKKPIGS